MKSITKPLNQPFNPDEFPKIIQPALPPDVPLERKVEGCIRHYEDAHAEQVVPPNLTDAEAAGVTPKRYLDAEKYQSPEVNDTSVSRPEWQPTILREAIDKTTGDRNRQYGDPQDNHGCTAGLWTLYLARRFPSFREQLKPEDVCSLNVLQKMSRLANDPTHLDSWVDVAGFAGNAGTCVELS